MSATDSTVDLPNLFQVWNAALVPLILGMRARRSYVNGPTREPAGEVCDPLVAGWPGQTAIGRREWAHYRKTQPSRPATITTAQAGAFQEVSATKAAAAIARARVEVMP